MSSSPDSPPKRPRLSLQIKAISNGPTVRTSRTLAAAVNPKSPTSFNTLSNVYVTAIGKSSTHVPSEPLTAIKTTRRLPLKIQTENVGADGRTQTQTPFVGGPSFPETPLTAQPLSPAVYTEIKFPSTMTATPPLSAGPTESNDAKVFTFSAQDTLFSAAGRTATATLAGAVEGSVVQSPRTPRRRTTVPASYAKAAPYTHPRALHTILRNSPLPRLPDKSPVSPRRQSARLQEKAARRVGYNNPLTQTITTNKYTRSHIDLLCEEASPFSPSNPPSEDPEVVLDLAMAYTGDETRDGGQTPGPFEEMRRRMAGLAASSPVSSPGGIRKRKKKEKKRRWVWTIGQEEDDGEDVGGAIAAIRAAEASGVSAPFGSSSSGDIFGNAAVETPVATQWSHQSVKASSSSGAPPVLPLSVPILSIPPVPSLKIDTSMIKATNPEQLQLEIITPSIESSGTSQESVFDDSLGADVEMSDVSSVLSDPFDRGLTPGELDIDLTTPAVPRKRQCTSRLGSEDLINAETGMRRDTPIPADLVA